MVVALVKLSLLKSPAITQPREPVKAVLVFLFWDTGLCPSPLGAATLVNSASRVFRIWMSHKPSVFLVPESLYSQWLSHCSFPAPLLSWASFSHSFSESGISAGCSGRSLSGTRLPIIPKLLPLPATDLQHHLYFHPSQAQRPEALAHPAARLVPAVLLSSSQPAPVVSRLGSSPVAGCPAASLDLLQSICTLLLK